MANEDMGFLDACSILGSADVEQMIHLAGHSAATAAGQSNGANLQLMANFYRNLGEPGISKAKALQRAQLAMFDDKRFKHPYFWAPFLMIGNWM